MQTPTHVHQADLDLVTSHVYGLKIPRIKKTSFKVDLKTDTSGASFFNKGELENLRCVLFFHHNTNRKIRTIPGITPNK